MASKTLNEAIERALCVGPLSEVKARLQNEIRDFIAHEIMKHGWEIEHREDWWNEKSETEILDSFFLRIFPK